MFIKTRLNNSQIHHLVRDLAITFLSIILAFILVRIGMIEELVQMTKPVAFLTEIFAGILFTSTFTTPLAIVTFLELGREGFNPYLTAVIAGVGAVVGDVIIYKFVKDDLTEDLKILSKGMRKTLIGKVLKSKLFVWLTPVLGALIIASPLPDELGVGLLGLTKLDPRVFVIISYSLNTLGILSILLFGSTL
jgi:hypothetical protein